MVNSAGIIIIVVVIIVVIVLVIGVTFFALRYKAKALKKPKGVPKAIRSPKPPRLDEGGDEEEEK